MAVLPPIAAALTPDRSGRTGQFQTKCAAAMPRLRRCLFPLDENLVTVLGTDVLSGVRGDDGHRKCGTGFAIGWRGRRLSRLAHRAGLCSR